MSYRVVFYAPDRHMTYDGDTPIRSGVGGGVTARIRMAEALAGLGHDVTVVANTSRTHTLRGVSYTPLGAGRKIEADVLIMNTSGGDLDLSPVTDLDLKVRLRLVWVQGYILPKGLETSGYDFVYCPSNFIRRVAIDEWDVPHEQTFVSYNSYPEALFPPQPSPAITDPFRLVYASHPSKGLDPALDILDRLRTVDARFQLHIFGGAALWGQPGDPVEGHPGVVDHGLIGQADFADALREMTFSINLQTRQEPFGNVVLESMRAGCLVIASPVGAYPELIRDGWNGFLVPGSADAAAARQAAADLILRLVKQEDFLELIRHNARQVPWSSRRVAHAWEGHWGWLLDSNGESSSLISGCPVCGESGLPLADGMHCTQCGTLFFARQRETTEH